MLSYNPRAAKALAQLKKHYNDVDIFVEDTGNHNMWLLILRALLPSGTKLESVNMLGGREAVTKACQLDQIPNGRKKLYIIDGDFDFLLGKKKKNLKYFYRIRANNIENLLINEHSLVSVALEQQPRKPENILKAELKFGQNYSHIDRALRPLFIAYAVANSLCPSLQTTGFSVKNLITHSPLGAKIDLQKVRNRIVRLYLNVSREKGTNLTRTMKNKADSKALQLQLCQVASGKDYVLPLFLLQFQKSFGYGRNDESFKVALARSFSPKVEPYFARRMRNLSI